jgi:hypothetical protein
MRSDGSLRISLVDILPSIGLVRVDGRPFTTKLLVKRRVWIATPTLRLVSGCFYGSGLKPAAG